MMATEGLLRPDTGQPATAIHLVDPAGFDAWLKAQPPRHRAAIAAQGMKAVGYAYAILPGDDPEHWSVASVVANVDSLSPWCLAKLAEVLPPGTYRVEGREPGVAMLGWILGQYRFDRYARAEDAAGPRVLLSGAPALIESIAREARATFLVRDMVNTPAADMGPEDIEAAVETLARSAGVTAKVTRGHDLETGFPMVHAVGRAADKRHAPRMVELEWGDPAHPRLAIVGKGVCFDTGGLDIKPASGMRLMKKDMGGAAHALALADMIIDARLPVRLHLLIPAVENAISGSAFRPGDVLRSRSGKSVEIHNTDAEGRLILADALTRAAEDKPDLIIDFATLTGAARVALGPDLPAMFASDDAIAGQLQTIAMDIGDPLWRMPLWQGYNEMLKSDLADFANAHDNGFAGAITAALFLSRFVSETVSWIHVDTYAWRAAAKPGRQKGGDALGLRAMFTMVNGRYTNLVKQP